MTIKVFHHQTRQTVKWKGVQFWGVSELDAAQVHTETKDTTEQKKKQGEPNKKKK